MTADSQHSGIEFYKTNFTNINSVVDGALVVGQSQGNPPSPLSGAAGVIAPRTNYMHFKNIRFYNFPQGTTPLRSCNLCSSISFSITGGKSTFF